jgi:hypothetical protein
MGLSPCIPDLTNEIWTPSARCRPLHSKHIKMPYDTDAHCGSFASQSQHIYIQDVSQSRVRLYVVDLTRSFALWRRDRLRSPCVWVLADDKSLTLLPGRLRSCASIPLSNDRAILDAMVINTWVPIGERSSFRGSAPNRNGGLAEPIPYPEPIFQIVRVSFRFF